MPVSFRHKGLITLSLPNWAELLYQKWQNPDERSSSQTGSNTLQMPRRPHFRLSVPIGYPSWRSLQADSAHSLKGQDGCYYQKGQHIPGPETIMNVKNQLVTSVDGNELIVDELTPHASENLREAVFRCAVNLGHLGTLRIFCSHNVVIWGL
jgi:hypothetical protein